MLQHAVGQVKGKGAAVGLRSASNDVALRDSQACHIRKTTTQAFSVHHPEIF